ncbi:N-6 DNA methylase [Actinoplanes sp. NPDC051411]|uniref:N-6 DNA methylase n=1 Tax=Actinoplanes sp. NPDC051411 TaxID=3155522 RepID=UPI003431F5B8
MPQPRDPRSPARLASAQAYRIADAIADAWTQRFDTGTDLHIPLSVTAALALLTPADDLRSDPGQKLGHLAPERLPIVLRDIWRKFIASRPDLAVRAAPLVGWLHPYPDDDHRISAHAITSAAVRAGLFDLTLDNERRRNTDLLGAVRQTLRSRRARTHRGEFFTPQDLAEALARITLDDIQDAPPGASLCDPAAGTGAMLCAAARIIRDCGRDPADFRWYANDIDPLTAACLAVNTHLWGLGRCVTIGCGDALADTWLEHAKIDRQAGLNALAVAGLRSLTTRS